MEKLQVGSVSLIWLWLRVFEQGGSLLDGLSLDTVVSWSLVVRQFLTALAISCSSGPSRAGRCFATK